ncbi:MAG: hypothetical protein E7497_07625 [Ruminococcus sp.]|nr:hypothetical protein [Ruminococcus sp.]
MDGNLKMDMEFLFPIIMGLFGIIFTVWIFCKSYSDNKKQEAILTEIYKQYGVNTTAKVIYCRNHINMSRTMPYKYELKVEFKYHSYIKENTEYCTATIKTNNPSCKTYENSILITYIPQYADYLNGFVDSKTLCNNLGFKVNLYSSAEMIILADDIGIYTNLSDL